MSTTTQPNEQAPAATVPQMTARFLLDQQARKLPAFTRLEVNERGVTATLASVALLRRWVKAYGGKVADIRSHDIKTYNPPYVHSTYRVNGWDGDRSLTLNADEDMVLTSGTKLDAVTVAGLEEIAAPAEPVAEEEKCAECGLPAGADHGECWGLRHGSTGMIKPTSASRLEEIAAPAEVCKCPWGCGCNACKDGCTAMERIADAQPKPLVSDETIREAEQISRMVLSTDLHLPQDECGCPIKTARDGNSFTDHCQACRESRIANLEVSA